MANIKLQHSKIHVSPEDKVILEAYARITQGYKSYTLKLEDIFCKGEEIEGGKSLNGQTAFFRHFVALRYLFKMLAWDGLQDKEISVLAAPSSIGCEANGIVGLALSYGFNRIIVDGFDRSQAFTDLARHKKYPHVLVRRIGELWRDLIFDMPSSQRALVPVKQDVSNRVRFLGPSGFQDFNASKNYDVVIINNLFQYLNSTDIILILEKVKQMKPKFVMFTKIGANDLPLSIGEGYSSFLDHPYTQNEATGIGEWSDAPIVSETYEIWCRNTP